MKYSVPAFLLALILASGCTLLQPKPKTKGPPPLPPAAEIEAEFHDRWMDKRVHELMTSGTAKTEADARRIASAEFTKQYPFVKVPSQGGKG
jgi:hypothetical protein